MKPVSTTRYRTATDALLSRSQRVIVAGTSGSGKTHLAARVGAALQLPHVEIDALHWGPGWVKRSSFEVEVAHLAQSSHWVTEWQYTAVRPLLARRADLLIWLDLSRSRVMWQVTRRSLGRAMRQQVLWNGNVEPQLWTLLRDPDHIIRWAWRTHMETQAQVEAIGRALPDLVIVRLKTRSEVEQWLRKIVAAY